MADSSHRKSSSRAIPDEVGAAAADPERAVGKYVILDKLGSGGMGDVWKAWDRELNRWVALKFLKADDPDEILRFEREAQTAGNLHHPNICAIYDVGTAGARHFIAMEYVAGQTLARFPRHDRRRLVDFMKDAALALHYAHEQGVIHRDLKPANLMVQEGRVFVMDFGLARTMKAGSSLTISGMMVGTPAYMSPEQARGEIRGSDARSDVYGIGATLYELLTDQPPFTHANVFDVAVAVVTEEPPTIRTLNPEIDPELATIVHKCMEKQPSRRYATARDVADDLQRWLAGDPILARPASTWQLIAKRVRRHKAVSGVTALLVIVLAAAAVALGLQRTHADTQIAAERARAQRREAALQRLTTQLTTILERKRELRTLATPAKLARKELHAAVLLVDRHVEEWPEEPHGWYVRARGRYCLGELDAAKADLDTVLRLHPGFRPAWTLLGMVRLEEFQERLYGNVRTLQQRMVESRPLLKAAIDAFDKGWQAGREREEAGRFGLPWTREDQVMERLARAIRMYYWDQKEPEAQAVLVEGMAEFRAEEYARFAGLWCGATKESLRLYDHGIAWAPGYEALFLDRGIARHDLGDLDGASADYDAAISLKSDFAMAYVDRGTLKQQRGDLEGAIADYTRATECRPGFSMALYNRGCAKHDRRDFAAAIEDYTLAVQGRPDWAEAYCNRGLAWNELGDPAKAVADCDEALRRAGPYADAYVNRGCAKRDQRDFPGALSDFNAAIAADARHALAWSYRGALKAELHEAGAMEDLDRAIALNERDPRHYLRRGIVKRAEGDLAGAIADFDRLVSLRPRDAEGWFNRGVARRQNGDHPGALADYDEAITLKPDHMEAHFNRGLVRRLTNDAAGAFDDFDRAISLGCTDASAFFQRGMLKVGRRDYPGAIADFDRAIERNQDFAEAYANRGRLRERANDLPGAVQDYERALKVAPETWPLRAKIESWLVAARLK